MSQIKSHQHVPGPWSNGIIKLKNDNKQANKKKNQSKTNQSKNQSKTKAVKMYSFPDYPELKKIDWPLEKKKKKKSWFLLWRETFRESMDH